MENQKVIPRSFRYWQVRIFAGLFVSTMLVNAARRNLAFAVPQLIEELHFDKNQVGIIGSCFSISFAFSKLFGGILCDIYSPKNILCIVMLIAGLVNILFGMCDQLWLLYPTIQMFSETESQYYLIVSMTFLWSINGICQGVAWIPVAKFLNVWYTKEEKATWWSATSSAQTVGGALVALGGSMLSTYFGWRSTFEIPGAFCVLESLLLWIFLLEDPKEINVYSHCDIGFLDREILFSQPKQLSELPLGKQRSIVSTLITNNDLIVDDTSCCCNPLMTTSSTQLSSRLVFSSYAVWSIGIASLFVHVIRTAMLDWGVVLLGERKGYQPLVSGTCMFWFECGGFIGGFLAALISDRFYHGDRIPVMLWYLVGMTLGTSFFCFSTTESYAINCVFAFSSGFFLYGPQTLLSMAAMEYFDSKIAGTVLGIVGALAGIGATFAGFPLSYIVQSGGWSLFGVILTGSGIFSWISLLPLVGYKRKQP